MHAQPTPPTPNPTQPTTHISVILDRSGSMEAIRADVVGGFNAFLARQQQEPGQATLSLVQFDSQDPYEVLLHLVPLPDVPPLTPERYVPRASTPLLDALGRGMADLNATLASLPAAQRPTQVVVVVVTDGLENASREFTHAQVRALLAAHEAQGWQFVYLSADLAAIDEAMALGFAHSHSMAYDPDRQGTEAMWQSVSDSTSDYRRGRRGDMSFGDEHRRRQRREQQRRQRPSAQPGKDVV